MARLADRMRLEVPSHIHENLPNFFVIGIAAPMVFGLLEYDYTAMTREHEEALEMMKEQCINPVNANDLVPRLPGQLDYIYDNLVCFIRDRKGNCLLRPQMNEAIKSFA